MCRSVRERRSRWRWGGCCRIITGSTMPRFSWSASIVNPWVCTAILRPITTPINHAYPDRAYLLPTAYLRFDHLRGTTGARFCEAGAPGDGDDHAVRQVAATRGDDGRRPCDPGPGRIAHKQGGHRADLWTGGNEPGTAQRCRPVASTAVRCSRRGNPCAHLGEAGGPYLSL